MTEGDAGAIQLLDFGDAGRLERFGARIVDRPHPGALGARRDPRAWLEADLRYDRDGGWSGPAAALGEWSVAVDGIPLLLRPTDAGQCGLFPEHREMLPWLRDRAAARVEMDATTAVLHLFAYTGLATLAMASARAAVTHVDSSRPTVAWARRNAETAGLADRPIRWIVDDARTFAEREARRGRRYAGLVLDPPSYGHGASGRAWQIETDLEPLLGICHAILVPGAFVLLTAHTATLGQDRLASALTRALRVTPSAIEAGDLGITSVDGRRLELGAFARVAGTA
jgi:23S rRNA (cytosine1962-C5)-methyltransferase